MLAKHHDISPDNAFRRWRDRVGLDNLKGASSLLGKSIRMVEYYEAGRHIPLDTRLLMMAIAEGFESRPWPEK